MAMKLTQGLKQTQSLMMTPQLQQAIKLLTLTHLEMTDLIAQEMVENPLLEESETESDIMTMTEKQSNEGQNQDVDNLEFANKEAQSNDFDGPDVVDGGKKEIDWEEYIDGFRSTSSSPSTFEHSSSDDLPNYENMVSRGETLAEHLEWQLRMENLTDEEWKLANFTINNLSDDGHLEISFDEVISNFSLEREDALEILKMIQNLDPVGCATRNLQECLLVQARTLSERSPLVERIIEHHLHDLQKHNYQGISKELGVPLEKIKDAENIILGFNPRPGRLISPEEPQYILPDIYVYEVGGEFVVSLNNEGVPRLKISTLYQSMLKNKKDHSATEFVQDKLRSAMWLIKSIQNRQRTILKVSEAIVKYQPDFFHKGSAYLKPMILKDIADEIGMHESTVSRVTTNKYMHTPLGIFELKYFFNAGIGGKDGGVDIASESLKCKIKHLIQQENTRRPLSDQKIVEILEKEGITVARRTVAKYREMMGISTSSQRKTN